MIHINTLSAGNILIGIVVLALKYAANALTATVARLSDAIESIVSRVWEGGGQGGGQARGPRHFLGLRSTNERRSDFLGGREHVELWSSMVV
jgi:hypothetical protein